MNRFFFHRLLAVLVAVGFVAAACTGSTEMSDTDGHQPRPAPSINSEAVTDPGSPTPDVADISESDAVDLESSGSDDVASAPVDTPFDWGGLAEELQGTYDEYSQKGRVYFDEKHDELCGYVARDSSQDKVAEWIDIVSGDDAGLRDQLTDLSGAGLDTLCRT